MRVRFFAGYKAAWRGCSNDTAVRHLDVDAPGVLKGLYEQELNGVWEHKTVQCSTGLFTPGAQYSAACSMLGYGWFA